MLPATVSTFSSEPPRRRRPAAACAPCAPPERSAAGGQGLSDLMIASAQPPGVAAMRPCVAEMVCTASSSPVLVPGHLGSPSRVWRRLGPPVKCEIRHRERGHEASWQPGIRCGRTQLGLLPAPADSNHSTLVLVGDWRIVVPSLAIPSCLAPRLRASRRGIRPQLKGA